MGKGSCGAPSIHRVWDPGLRETASSKEKIWYYIQNAGKRPFISMKGYSAQQLVKHTDSEEESSSPTSAPRSGDRGGWENIQASKFHVRWYWRVCSLSTPYLTLRAPMPPQGRPGRSCPEPTCGGSKRHLLPSKTASDRHRRI